MAAIPVSLGQPAGLWALVALVPIAAAWWLARAHLRRARLLVGSEAPPRPKRRPSTALLLLTLAVTAAALGIARPQWGHTEEPLARRGIDIAVALDISRSMEAPDVAPSRAVAAADGLSDLLDRLRGDRVGLVTFAGSAFRRSPLTLDLDALGQLFAGAQAEGALVGPGTDLGAAIRAALETLRVPDPAETAVIVLVSDGEGLGDGGVLAAAEAAERGMRIYTVAVGTDAGATLPVADGDETPSEAGGASTTGGAGDNLSRADRAALRALAEATGGDLREVQALPGLAVEFARLRLTDFDEADRRVPRDRSAWCFGAAALLLAAATSLPMRGLPMRGLPLRRRRGGEARRAIAGGGLLALLLLAACSGDAAYRANEDGNDAYARGAFDEALRHYRAGLEADPANAALEYNIGHALHALGRYPEAIAASGRALALTADADIARDALYATGNHEFARGNLQAARDAYVAVLLRDSEDRDAKANLELTLRLLRPPSAPEPPEPPAPPTGEDGDGDGPSAPPEPGESDPGDGNAPPGDGDDDGETPGETGDGSSGGETGEAGETPDGSAPGDGTGDGLGGDARTLAEAEAALRQALEALAGRTPTEAEALELLDLLRLTSGLRALPDRGGGPGDR